MMKLRCFSDEKLLNLLKAACIKESIFWTERHYFPDSEELVTPNERDEMISYLLEVCDRTDMQLSIDTFSLTVTLVDRFLASFKVKSKYLECLSVSCLYIAAKIREEDEKIPVTCDFLLDCNSKCSVNELLRMELMILKKFEWSVDDVTASDFLYMFHGILVNKYNKFSSLNDGLVITKNKWNVMNMAVVDGDSAFPPVDLDFLHSLEYKLKQLLCTHELATLFRSRVIAFALLSIQVHKVFEVSDESENNNVASSTKSINSIMHEAMKQLQHRSKITDSILAECKSKITEYLAAIDADKNLMESYMVQYYSEMAKQHRVNSRLSVTLSAIAAKHLAAIKEEDETIEDQQQQQPSRFLATISNQLKRQSSAMDTTASNLCASKKNDTPPFSYADIVLGFRDNKRKLSENSMTDSEDYEDFDCENQRN